MTQNNKTIKGRILATEAETDAIADYEARFPDGDTRMADEVSADSRRAQEQEDADLDAAMDAEIQRHREEQELRENPGKLHIPVITGDGERLEMTEAQIKEAAARDPDLRLESPDENDLVPTDENIAALRNHYEQERRKYEIDYDTVLDPDYLGRQAEAQFNRTEDHDVSGLEPLQEVPLSEHPIFADRDDSEHQAWEERQADLLRQQQARVAAGREAEAKGERVIYVHGQPYADPGDERENIAYGRTGNLQQIEAASADMMISLVDRVKDDMAFIRENITQLPAQGRSQVTDAYRQLVTEAAAEVEQDRQAERRHDDGRDLEL